MRERLYPFDRFLQDIEAYPPQRVTGTAIFMTSNLQGTPPTLLHNLHHNKVLHERVILLTVVTSDVPYVDADDRAEVEPLGQGFYRLTLRYGFMEEPDVPEALQRSFRARVSRSTSTDTTFFLGVETLLATRRPGLPLWRERLFVLIARNAVRANAFFKIPPGTRRGARHAGGALNSIPHHDQLNPESLILEALILESLILESLVRSNSRDR